MTCIIIEDEFSGQEILKIKLKKFFPNIEILQIINNKNDSISYLREHDSQVSFIFLDIEIKGGTGIEVLEALPNRGFDVIFTTAYHEYALAGFQLDAIHYLLKPFNDEDFCEAVKRVSRKRLAKLDDKPDYILHSEKNEIIKIKLSDICFFKSDGAYTEIYLENKKFVSSKNIGEIEKMLLDYTFSRVHHSYIINRDKVEKIDKKRNGVVTLKGNYTVPISQRKLKDFLGRINMKVKDKKAEDE